MNSDPEAAGNCRMPPCELSRQRINIKSFCATLLALALLLLFDCGSSSRTWAVPPEVPATPYNYVVDLAGVIPDDAETRLNAYLKELELKTTAQFVILTLDSLEGESLEQFSLETAHNKWRLGQKGKDNGVLLTVAVKDRKYRFEIGYGLEGVLPDSLAGSIGREYLVPYFKKGDYGSGIFNAALFITRTIAAGSDVEITGLPEVKREFPRGKRRTGLLDKVLVVLFIVGVVYMFIRHPRLLFLLLLSSSMGGRRSGWSGGGGFGGGGGGGFGGGGSSGSW